MGDYGGDGGDYANPFQDSAVVDAVNDDGGSGGGYSEFGPGSAFYKGPPQGAQAQGPSPTSTGCVRRERARRERAR